MKLESPKGSDEDGGSHQRSIKRERKAGLTACQMTVVLSLRHLVVSSWQYVTS